MRILHYTLGFPPHRTGGLVKYSIDLMEEQQKNGNEVSVLYPGKQSFFHRKCNIREKNRDTIVKYELNNGLPLALFGGIINPDIFMEEIDRSIYLEFLNEIKPDIIHIHTLMGIHKEFFEAAKQLKIKMIFTTHDYYGLAPDPTFYANGVSFDEKNTNESWNLMSQNAMSIKKLYLFQSKYYPLIRTIGKVIAKIKKNEKPENNHLKEYKDFTLLKKYYKSIFDLIDIFHFNSTQTKNVYMKNGIIPSFLEVIPVTNYNIKKENFVEKKVKNKKSVIAYIGPDKEYKGYFDFIKLAELLDRDKYEVRTYGHNPTDKCPDFIKQFGRFDSKKSGAVYSEIDVLIVPSKWKETFGLIVLEGLSFGVKVFVSDSVGAKEILEKEDIFINYICLAEQLNNEEIEVNKITNFPNMSEHCGKLLDVYKNGVK